MESNFFVLRNDKEYGPFTIDQLAGLVRAGKLLKQDVVREMTGIEEVTVGRLLKHFGVRVKVESRGGFFNQLQAIGASTIFPRAAFSSASFLSDKRMMTLAAIGLAPAFLITFTGSSYLTFYAIAFYFSAIWGLFFYYLFQTRQVKVKTTISVFLLTQLFVVLFIGLQNFPVIKELYALTNANGLLPRFVGYVFGVGVLEESIKAIPVIYLALTAKRPLIPQTLVFYGLMSGIGFGVFEGVLYQTSYNVELDYSSAFFMNIARLTSLPFLHAIWAGIAGYFIAFAVLKPMYRRSMYAIAILLPATLHGAYNTLGWSIAGLLVTLMGVGLLITYLNHSEDMQSSLK